MRTVLKAILRRWKHDLHREEMVQLRKTSAAARDALVRFQQCKADIKPLMLMCKANSVPKIMFSHVQKITRHIEKREYKEAHDEYMLLAIGNAPWPMGVTAVGIHARRR